MRLDIGSKNPGDQYRCMHARVLADGVLQTPARDGIAKTPPLAILAVDEEEGSIVHLARDADGRFYANDGEMVHHTWWPTSVRIEFDEDFDSVLAADLSIPGKWMPLP